jgi:hypothetical protein
MLTPVIAERPAQPYVAIRAQVTMQTMDDILLPLQPQVLAWLRERGIPAAGPLFWKYNVIDMDRALEVEVGVPARPHPHPPATTRQPSSLPARHAQTTTPPKNPAPGRTHQPAEPALRRLPDQRSR